MLVACNAGVAGTALQLLLMPLLLKSLCRLAFWLPPSVCARVRDGRTLTDVSGKLALLTPGQQCTFTVSSPPWAGVWAPSLTLRFSSSGSQGWPPHHLGYPWRPQRPLRAATSVALPFNGGDFSQGRYDFAPFTFSTPAQRPPRVTVESVISGGRVGRSMHGWMGGCCSGRRAGRWVGDSLGCSNPLRGGRAC